MDGGLRSSTGATALIWLSGGRTVDFVTVRVVEQFICAPVRDVQCATGEVGVY